MADTTYLSKKEAAAACGCDETTIQRYKRNGKLPNSRYGEGGVLEVAVADLVAAGLLDPLAVAGDVSGLGGRARIERDLVDARQELAVATARLDALSDRVARSDEEIAFLRSLLAKADA